VIFLDRNGVSLEKKKIAIYFDDFSENQIAKKTGICLKDTSTKIFIENTKGNVEVIPYCKIIRIVEIGGVA